MARPFTLTVLVAWAVVARARSLGALWPAAEPTAVGNGMLWIQRPLPHTTLILDAAGTTAAGSAPVSGISVGTELPLASRLMRSNGTMTLCVSLGAHEGARWRSRWPGPYSTHSRSL